MKQVPNTQMNSYRDTLIIYCLYLFNIKIELNLNLLFIFSGL